MYQMLSQSVRFCRLYIKKHFGVFFSVHSVLGATEEGLMSGPAVIMRSDLYDPTTFI